MVGKEKHVTAVFFNFVVFFGGQPNGKNGILDTWARSPLHKQKVRTK